MKRVMLSLAILAACSFAFAGAANAAGLGVRGVGGHMTIVAPENIDASIGVGFMLDMDVIDTPFNVESYASYWSHTQSAFGVEASVSDFVIGGRGKYNFTTSSPFVHPYVGAGLGFHFVTAGVNFDAYFPGTSASDTNLKVGLDLGGGFAWDIGNRWSLLTDAWGVIVSDVNQFAIRLGAIYRM